MAKPNLAKPNQLEIASSEKDITRGWIDKLMQPEDAILLQRGGGDLKIYRELLRDDQVISTWQQRREALTSKDTVITSGGTSAIDKKAADALRENFERLEWDRITDRMHYGLMYGYTVGEVLWDYDGKQIIIDDIKTRRPGRFRFGRQGELYMLSKKHSDGELMQTDTKGPITVGEGNPYGGKFWSYSTGSDNDDNYYGLGLGHQLYWPVFFKRNGMKFWLTFLEKFASPTAMAKVPAAVYADVDKRADVLAALRAIKSDTAMVMPGEETIVELIEASRSGTADYDTMNLRMNQAISKIVLSQTMTTDDGSSKAQADVHKGVRDEIVQGDADLLCGSFNVTVSRWWTDYNFPGATPPKVTRKTEEDADLVEVADRDTKIYALGFEPTEDYIKDTYGEGWVKRDMSAGIGGAENPFGPEGIPPEFAEAISEIANKKVGHRSDMQALVEAAAKISKNYKGVTGARVDELLGYLSETDDLLTFREKLTAMVGETPPRQAIDKLHRAGFVARLMGALRNGAE